MTAPSSATNEILRKIVHILTVSLALTFRWLPASWAFLLGVLAFIHNVMIFPKYAPVLFRENEQMIQGIAIYPLMIALLVLLFPDNLVLAGGAWAILAFGDGFSSLLGRVWRIAAIPWNPPKSLGGLLSFIIFGTVGTFCIMSFIGPEYSYQHVLLVAFIACCVTAVYETLPIAIDDNIVVSLIGAAFLGMLWDVDFRYADESISAGWWGLSLLINLGIASLALWMQMISTTGALSGAFLGTTILAMGGWSLYALLVLFFIFATLATKIGYHEKEALGIAQEDKAAPRQTCSCQWDSGITCSCVVWVQ